MTVEIADIGVRFRGVEGIAQVVEECCTLPAQALLNIGVGQVGSVKEVSCGYSNGMTGPFLEHRRVLMLEAEGCLWRHAVTWADAVYESGDLVFG